MCGRFALTSPPQVVKEFFRYEEEPDFPQRYNIAPSQPVAIVVAGLRGPADRTRHFMLMRWGFIPQFIKDPKDYPLVFNARSETVAEKGSFRAALRHRRCLFPADAFYEWRREPGPRTAKGTPFMLRRRDGDPIGFAGLWETWSGPDGEAVDTACILTTAANRTTAALHPRLPAIIEPGDFETWLDPASDTAFACDLLRPASEAVLSFEAIGPRVNSAAHDGPDVQGRAEATLEPRAPTQGELF